MGVRVGRVGGGLWKGHPHRESRCQEDEGRKGRQRRGECRDQKRPREMKLDMINNKREGRRDWKERGIKRNRKGK